MIETHAFSRLLNKKVEKILTNQSGRESVDKALDVIWALRTVPDLKSQSKKRFRKEYLTLTTTCLLKRLSIVLKTYLLSVSM